jgi:hypothetical protein
MKLIRITCEYVDNGKTKLTKRGHVPIEYMMKAKRPASCAIAAGSTMLEQFWLHVVLMGMFDDMDLDTIEVPDFWEDD